MYSICYQAEKLQVVSSLQSAQAINKIAIWQEVMKRVYILGGILVYRSHWQHVQNLVQQEVEWEDFYRLHYWSRYILTMASRSGQLEKQGWIPSVVDYVEHQQWISQLFMSNKDQIINSVCQFDFLQCVYTSIKDTGEVDVTRPYPSFGLYYKFRTEPVVAKLVIPGVLRDTLSNLGDNQLALLIQDLDRNAARIFIMFSGWEQGNWLDKRIQKFLADHFE